MTFLAPVTDLRSYAAAAVFDDDTVTQPWQQSVDHKHHNELQQVQPGHDQAPETRPSHREGGKRKRRRGSDSEGDDRETDESVGQRRRQTKRRHCSNISADKRIGHQQDETQPSKHPSFSSSLNGQGGRQMDDQANGQAIGRIVSPVNHELDNPTRPVIKGGRWTEQDLRRVIAKAIKSPFPGVSVIHPTASVIANSIVIPSVPLHVFHTLHDLLPIHPATASWKAEFHDQSTSVGRSRRRRGRLVVTMPTRVHEEFIAFSSDIADQLFRSNLLPPRYTRKEIKQSGGTRISIGTRTLTPDAGIALFDSRKTFLVLEVAYSQTEEAAKRKGQAYILDTDGRIKFVVLITINKGAWSAASPLERDDHLSPDHDTVHVHVYKAKMLPDGGITGEKLIDRVQIFPGLASNDTFSITWSDVNCGTWDRFRDAARLLPDTPEPNCEISFSSLVSIARGLAGQASDGGSGENSPLYRGEDVNLAVTPPTQRLKFLDSSSPAVHLTSSGGTVPSDQERRHDPDYEPFTGSSQSSD